MYTTVEIQGASVNRAILQHCFFFWFGNTGADAAIAILLPTLKRFSCNGAVEWSTTCFCCESVLPNGDNFLVARREFRRRSVFIAIVLFHHPMPSRPGFDTSRLLVLH